jgi:hypothetical protein
VHAGVFDIGKKSLRNMMNHHHLEGGVCLARMGHFANVMTVLRNMMIHHLDSIRLAREGIQVRVDATRRVSLAILQTPIEGVRNSGALAMIVPYKGTKGVILARRSWPILSINSHRTPEWPLMREREFMRMRIAPRTQDSGILVELSGT